MWKQIKDIPKLEINEEGEVRNIRTKKIRTQYYTPTGYAQIRVKENYKEKYYYVHRLVYQTFNGEIPSDKEINHIDGNPKNNSLNNLEIITHQENCIHRSTLKNNSTKKIEVRYLNGETKKFNSRKECAEYYQIDESTVRDYMKSNCTPRRKIQAEFYYI